MAAAKTEESVHDLLGGEESCGADGCRHIGIAPDGMIDQLTEFVVTYR